MTLAEQARAVESREDLVAFIGRLRDDLGRNPGDWENGDLPSFLEAMAAWTADMLGYYRNTGQVLSGLSP
jgi:hypothetical protein